MRLAAMLLSVAALTLAFAANAIAEQRDARVITLTTAEVAATTNGQARPIERIALPLHWDVAYPNQSGTATLTLKFNRPVGSEHDSEPYAIFTMRISNAYAFELNGTLLATAGDLNDIGGRWSSKQPVDITFPAKLLGDVNVLKIRIRGDTARRAGLAPITLGPASLVEPMHLRAYLLRVAITMACAMLSLLVSGFCLLLWLQQRDKLYAWAFIGEAVWTLTVADVILEWLPLRWMEWTTLLISLRAIWIWALYIIVEQVFGSRPKIERLSLMIATIVTPLTLIFSPVFQSNLPFRISRGIMALLFIVMLVRLLFGPRGRLSAERILLWFGIAVLLAAGVHDAFSSSLFSSQYGDAVWAKYAGSLLALTIMLIVSKRFRSARAEAKQLQNSLELRIDQKERELRDTFAKLSATERSHAVIAERERILRDMHDGVGANLATAMRQLESGTAPVTEVAASLRESLDHLKLSIDAMNLPSGDVNALLASLRYRLQPRIESAGLTVEWQVDELPHWPQGGDQTMRHLQFLLLEAISNSLQHAHASTLTLSAKAEQGQISIASCDNGRGFDNQPGRGLQSMRSRAQAIGAELQIESTPQGTCVRVGLALP